MNLELIRSRPRRFTRASLGAPDSQPGDWTVDLAGPHRSTRVVVRLDVTDSPLGRAEPLEGRTPADWLLVAVTFFLAWAAAEVGRVIGDPQSPLLLAVVALPYTGI